MPAEPYLKKPVQSVHRAALGLERHSGSSLLGSRDCLAVVDERKECPASL